VSRPAYELRAARREDAAAINAIHNHYVGTSTTTFQIEPWDVPRREAWLGEHDERHPVVVIESDGAVIAWGALSRFHPRDAYAPTAEPSIYVRHDRLGEGWGRVLMRHLIEAGRAAGLRSLVSLVAGDQAASLAMHEAFGFEEAGVLREVGEKFGRRLDVVYLQRML